MVDSEFVDVTLGRLKLTLIPFQILKDDANLSEISILQPLGTVTGNDESVLTTDNALLTSKIFSFLNLETTKKSDLISIPEYCAPWEILEKININEVAPAKGQLWVLGFQGITPAKLADIENRCTNIAFEYQRDIQSTKKFFGPILYIFKALKDNGEEKTVCIVQFKTHPMADGHQFEKDNLIVGNKLYILKNAEDDIRLATLICADSLNPAITTNFQNVFKDWKDKAYWLLHLQLNTDPRNTSFKKYRDDELGGVRNTDRKAILCLNWAQNTNIAGSEARLNEYGVSALYLKEKDLKVNNKAIDSNHKRGTYYSFTETRAHVSHFNFAEAVFHFNLAKIARNNVSGPAGTIHLPTIKSSYIWSSTTWISPSEFDDLSKEICPWRSPKHPLLEASLPLPTQREFLMLRSTGHFNGAIDSPKDLDSFKMDSVESIQRLTFSQDTARNAKNFREAVIGRFRKLLDIVHQAGPFPEVWRSFRIKGALRVVDDPPFFNLTVTNNENEEFDIFVSYLGPQSLREKTESIASLQGKYKSDFRKRVFLWNETAGNITSFTITEAKINNPENTEFIDITGA